MPALLTRGFQAPGSHRLSKGGLIVPSAGSYDPSNYGVTFSDLLWASDEETSWPSDGGNLTEWLNTGIEDVDAAFQATKPKYTAAHPALNNRPAVLFADDVDDRITIDSTNTYTKPTTIVIVASLVQDSGFRYVVDGVTTVSERFGVLRRTAGQWAMYAGTNADLDSDTTTTTVFIAATFAGNPNDKGYQNGTAYTGLSAGTNTTFDSFTVGGAYDGGASGRDGTLHVGMVAVTEQDLLANGNFAAFAASTMAYYGIAPPVTAEDGFLINGSGDALLINAAGDRLLL